MIKKGLVSQEDVLAKVRTTQKSITKNISKNEEVKSKLRGLSKYKDKYLLLTNEKDIREYFDSIIENGICAIDTETTGLRFYNDKVVGISLYTPTEKACYIPTHHLNPITNAPIAENARKNL